MNVNTCTNNSLNSVVLTTFNSLTEQKVISPLERHTCNYSNGNTLSEVLAHLAKFPK